MTVTKVQYFRMEELRILLGITLQWEAALLGIYQFKKRIQVSMGPALEIILCPLAKGWFSHIARVSCRRYLSRLLKYVELS